jgi:hypothetical protein
MRQKVRASFDIQLASGTIPKGTVGYVPRLSKRLEKARCYSKDEIWLKFPNHKSFIGTTREVELI